MRNFAANPAVKIIVRKGEMHIVLCAKKNFINQNLKIYLKKIFVAKNVVWNTKEIVVLLENASFVKKNTKRNVDLIQHIVLGNVERILQRI